MNSRNICALGRLSTPRPLSIGVFSKTMTTTVFSAPSSTVPERVDAAALRVEMNPEGKEEGGNPADGAADASYFVSQSLQSCSRANISGESANDLSPA